MRRGLGIAAVAAVPCSLGFLPAVAGARPARPDLVVSVIASLGTPHYILIDQSGHALPLRLRITTTNVGRAKASAISDTAVYAIGQGASRPSLIASAARALAPGQSSTTTARDAADFLKPTTRYHHAEGGR